MTTKAVCPKNLFVIFLTLVLLSACGGTQDNGDVQKEESNYTCPYILPFKTEGKFKLTQGNLSTDTTWSHTAGTLNEYAFDFAMPEGTPVLAIRDGVVSKIHDGETVFGGPRYVNNANYVILDHGDGVFSVYMHLQRTVFALSDEGKARVKQGQIIGYSGRTGYTNGAYHLHFQLQASGSGFARSIPVPCFEGVEGLPQLYGLYAAAEDQPSIGGNVSGVSGSNDADIKDLVGTWHGDVSQPSDTEYDVFFISTIDVEISDVGCGEALCLKIPAWGTQSSVKSIDGNTACFVEDLGEFCFTLLSSDKIELRSSGPDGTNGILERVGTNLNSELKNLVGVWEGPISSGGEFYQETETKRFEIKANCAQKAFCLFIAWWELEDVFVPIDEPDLNELESPVYCFGSSSELAQGFSITWFCFHPIDQNTLKHEGGGGLWYEEGTLNRVGGN